MCPKCPADGFEAALQLQLLLQHCDSDLFALGLTQQLLVRLLHLLVLVLRNDDFGPHPPGLRLVLTEEVLGHCVSGAAHRCCNLLDAKAIGMKVLHELLFNWRHVHERGILLHGLLARHRKKDLPDGFGAVPELLHACTDAVGQVHSQVADFGRHGRRTGKSAAFVARKGKS